MTAAHCLPERPDGQRLPPPHGFSYSEERTYANLLAPLGEQPSVWCECFFVDPIADIAVLGAPEHVDLFKQAKAYEALVEKTTPLTVAEPPSKPSRALRGYRECPAFLLSLTNQWFLCKVWRRHQPKADISMR